MLVCNLSSKVMFAVYSLEYEWCYVYHLIIWPLRSFVGWSQIEKYSGHILQEEEEHKDNPRLTPEEHAYATEWVTHWRYTVTMVTRTPQMHICATE